jgi:hypothetical protein
MSQISLNLSSHKPKEIESCLDILSKQLQKEKTKLKRLYTLYAEGNDTVLEMIKETESGIDELKLKIQNEMKNPDNSQKKEFVYDNIKKLADVWEHIDKQNKNRILKTIISKIIIVNGNIEIQLKKF